jgi:hypothetical protein
MAKFLAAWVTHAAVGWAVVPMIRMRRLVCSMTDVLALSGQGDGLDEVCCQECVGLGAQEVGPGCSGPVRCRVDSLGLEDRPDGGGGDLDAEAMGYPLLEELGEEFAVYASVAPGGVLADQA